MERAHDGVATAVGVAQGNHEIASAGEDGKVNFYSLREQKLIATWCKKPLKHNMFTLNHLIQLVARV